MKNKNWQHRKFVQKPAPRYPHLTEENALKAGGSAFSAGIPVQNNPYKENNLRHAWMRGFKRTERIFIEGLRLSRRVQESLPLEEVES